MVLEIFLIIISLIAVISSIRILLGPSVWDRILGFNLLSSKIIMIIVIFASISKTSYLLDMALVFALLGFIGTILIARIVHEKRNI